MPLIIEEKAAHDVSGYQWSYKFDHSAGVKKKHGSVHKEVSPIKCTCLIEIYANLTACPESKAQLENHDDAVLSLQIVVHLLGVH